MPPVLRIECAGTEDVAAIRPLEHISRERLLEKVVGHQMLVARLDGATVGWLRFGYLWDQIPFMNMLYVLEPHRGRGIGRQLVSFWEDQMRQGGYGRVMTSTQADENAQHFYRKLGYADIGGFVLPGETMELVLHKALV
jgi:GNAT superfamily N-acetyltransferase